MMRESMIDRVHALVGGGWLFAWLMLEMVFFGEPMFKYSSSVVGLTLYYVTVCAVLIASIALSVGVSRCPSIMQNNMSVLSCGIAGSVILVVIRVSVAVSPHAFSRMAALIACSIVFGVCAIYLLASFMQRTMEVVFAKGLRGTLCSALVGIALSFLLLPRFLRDGIYGETLVAISPLAVGATTCLLGRGYATGTGEQVRIGEPDSTRTQKMAILNLVELAALSLLMYLVSYFDYIAASVRVVVDENTYLYVAVLVMIAILIAALLLARTERQLTTSVLLLLLLGIMIITLVAFFGVLTYVVFGGDYVYPLTKLLRRVVKIGMLFALVITLYQSSLPSAPAFLSVIVLPLVSGKLIQLTIANVPALSGLVTQHQYFYLISIGFVAIILWSLVLATCVRNSAMLSAQASGVEDTVSYGGGDACAAKLDARIAVMARDHGLTEREMDVLGYLAAGYSLKAIAGKLCVSQNTVKTHVTGIYRKTGAHARQDVIDLLYEDGNPSGSKSRSH